MHIHVVMSSHRSELLKCECCNEQPSKHRLSIRSGDKLVDSVDVCYDCLESGNDILEISIPNPLVQQAMRIRRKQIKIGERRTAAAIGGRQTPGSGSGRIKGDAINEDWMIEEKTTSGKSYRITQGVINKMFSQAAGQRKEPALRLKMQGIKRDLAIMRWDTALRFIKEETDD